MGRKGGYREEGSGPWAGFMDPSYHALWFFNFHYLFSYFVVLVQPWTYVATGRSLALDFSCQISTPSLAIFMQRL